MIWAGLKISKPAKTQIKPAEKPTPLDRPRAHQNLPKLELPYWETTNANQKWTELVEMEQIPQKIICHPYTQGWPPLQNLNNQLQTTEVHHNRDCSSHLNRWWQLHWWGWRLLHLDYYGDDTSIDLQPPVSSLRPLHQHTERKETKKKKQNMRD